MTTTKTRKSRVWYVSWVYLCIAALLFVWIGVKTQITADRQERDAQQALVFADATRDCLKQLLDALDARNHDAEEENLLAADQHVIITDIFLKLSENGTPSGTNWDAVRDDIDRLVRVQEDRDTLLSNQQAHPYPDPSCPEVDHG